MTGIGTHAGPEPGWREHRRDRCGACPVPGWLRIPVCASDRKLLPWSRAGGYSRLRGKVSLPLARRSAQRGRLPSAVSPHLTGQQLALLVGYEGAPAAQGLQESLGDQDRDCPAYCYPADAVLGGEFMLAGEPAGDLA
jgi:hypothetical protein